MQSSLQNVRLILSATSFVIACTLGQCLSAFAANVNLAWDPKTDSGLAGYKVYYGTSSRSYGTPINVGNVTSYSMPGLNSGTYYFAVTAYYTSGNETGFSNEVSTTVTSVTPDSTPPTITLTSPSNGSSVSGTVTVSANASDNIGVAGVQFMVDGVSLGSEDTSAPYSVSWNTTVANGTHTLTARARDAAGNQTTSSAITVNVSNTATAPTLSGLVGAFAFSENSGTNTADSSGNSNTGSLSGASWTSQGRFGNALSFDGLSNVITVNDSSSLALSNAMTLEAWVYPISSLAGWKSVVQKEGDGYFLYASSDQGNVPAVGGNFGSASTAQNAFGASPLPSNTWTHLAATYDGSILRLFVNGSQVNSGTVLGSSIRNDPLPLHIGNSQYPGEGFPGRIDEVRIYSRALTQSEIQNDMNTPIGGTSPADTTLLPAPTNVSVK